MSTKTYSNKSNAKRAAKAAGLDVNNLCFTQLSANEWYWTEVEAEDDAAIEAAGRADLFDEPLPRPYRLHKPSAEARAAAKAKRAAAKAPAPAPVAAATPAAAAIPAGTVPAHKDFQVYGKSQILKPVEVVHNFLNANGANLSRKQALFALAELGVNYATARTQYQRWFAANRSGK